MRNYLYSLSVSWKYLCKYLLCAFCFYGFGDHWLHLFKVKTYRMLLISYIHTNKGIEFIILFICVVYVWLRLITLWFLPSVLWIKFIRIMLRKVIYYFDHNGSPYRVDAISFRVCIWRCLLVLFWKCNYHIGLLIKANNNNIFQIFEYLIHFTSA